MTIYQRATWYMPLQEKENETLIRKASSFSVPDFVCFNKHNYNILIWESSFSKL